MSGDDKRRMFPSENAHRQLSVAIPPFAFLKPFTRTQDEEDTAYQEHCDNNRCEIYDEPVTQSASCIVFTIGLKRKLPDALNCWLTGVVLGRPPFLSAVQIAAGLDMA
jgi:hypothetical protein